MVALVCFLESGSFAHALGLAISMGGDCDTLAAVTGSLAEAYYAIPGDLLAADLSRLDEDRKSTRLNSSHVQISYAVFCLKKKKRGRECL